MFEGPLSPGAGLIVQFSANVRDGALSHKIDCLSYLLKILNLEGHQNCKIGLKVKAIFAEFV